MQELFKKEGRKIQVSPRVYAWLISTGLVLFCVHNRALTYTNEEEITSFFLPWIGFALVLMGLFFLSGKKDFKWSLGNKLIWIPMLIIIGTTIISGVVNYGWLGTIPSTLFIITLFILYIASRTLGDDIFIAFIPAIIIESISCIVLGSSGVRNGGIISITNYDISSGLLVFGTLVSAYKGRWWLTAIALTGLFFTGAEEGILGVGVTFLAILANRDFNKKLLLPIGTLVVLLIVCTPLGITQKLYSPLFSKTSATKEAIAQTEVGEALDIIIPEAIQKPIFNKLSQAEVKTEAGSKPEEFMEEATGYRWLTHWSLGNANAKELLIGNGYNIMNFYHSIQHNVPLLIIYQIGIVAALAWLWITGYCLFKYKSKSYVLIAVVALSGFDHYFWTQVAPWWWAMIGVASTSSIKGDYIFKEV